MPENSIFLFHPHIPSAVTSRRPHIPCWFRHQSLQPPQCEAPSAKYPWSLMHIKSLTGGSRNESNELTNRRNCNIAQLQSIRKILGFRRVELENKPGRSATHGECETANSTTFGPCHVPHSHTFLQSQKQSPNIKQNVHKNSKGLIQMSVFVLPVSNGLLCLVVGFHVPVLNIQRILLYMHCLQS